MSNEKNMMEKFEFLIGSWNLEYSIPKSKFSEATTGAGTGTIKRALDEKYVFFDYSASTGTSQAAAHGIFAWDSKVEIYRYWWFEDSGNFLTATCEFINDETLFLNWHDTLLIQTFTKESLDKIILRMENPTPEGKYGLVLEVIFTKNF